MFIYLRYKTTEPIILLVISGQPINLSHHYQYKEA